MNFNDCDKLSIKYYWNSNSAVNLDKVENEYNCFNDFYFNTAIAALYISQPEEFQIRFITDPRMCHF